MPSGGANVYSNYTQSPTRSNLVTSQNGPISQLNNANLHTIWNDGVMNGQSSSSMTVHIERLKQEMQQSRYKRSLDLDK